MPTVAAAGRRGMLLHSGFTVLQIRDAQRRQRQAYEEAMADVWFRQMGEIIGHRGKRAARRVLGASQ